MKIKTIKKTDHYKTGSKNNNNKKGELPVCRLVNSCLTPRGLHMYILLRTEINVIHGQRITETIRQIMQANRFA